MDRKPVDVMVVNFNTGSLLQPMFDALRRAGSERLASYLVVDNASADNLSLIHISEPTRREWLSRMPSSA